MAGQPPSARSDPKALLVRGVNWLGDAVMTMPALQRLRQRFPQTQITLLTSDKLAELWQHHSALDRVMAFGQNESPWPIAKRLRRNHFDAALILPNSPRSALEAWLARIPRRIAYAGKWRTWLLTDPVNYPTGRLRLRRRGVREIKRLVDQGNATGAVAGPESSLPVHQMNDYLFLAATLGANPKPLAPMLELNADERASAAALLSSLPLPKSKENAGSDTLWLGLNPSTAYGPAKRWPIERFAQVASEIARRVPNSAWLAFGTGADWELCEQLAGSGAGRIINLAGKTSLRQLMGLLNQCRLLLTNDSGPMHLAAALGTPVVVPFGSTSPELTGPGQPGDPLHHLLRHPVACSPCFRRSCPIDFRCMTGIGVDQVVMAILETIGS